MSDVKSEKRSKGGIYCKCGERAVILHRGDYVCDECRRYGLWPRYMKLMGLRKDR